MFYIYVLQSEMDHGLYIGFSSDLGRRMKEHCDGLSLATKHRRPWRLVYYEAYLEEADARGREVFLKSGAGRTYLRKQCRHHFAAHPLRGATSDANPKPREASPFTRDKLKGSIPPPKPGLINPNWPLPPAGEGPARA